MLIKTTISCDTFETKPTTEEKKHLKFTNKEITLDEFIHCITVESRAFTSIFDYEGEFEFRGSGSKCNHYIGSQTINIDLDHMSIPMKETYDSVKLKPTFCYETCSNGKPNQDGIAEYSYRFIYVFDSVLEGVEAYTSYYEQLCTINSLEYDKRARFPWQNMFGCKTGRTIVSNIIYKSNQFKLNSNSNISLNKSAKTYIQQTTTDNYTSLHFFSDEIKKDFFSMSYSEFYNKYKETHRNIQCSPFPTEIPDESVMMIELGEDFYEIFRWKMNEKKQAIRLVHGDHRLNNIMNWLKIRRLITKDLSADELLVCAAYEMSHWIDNSDNHITKAKLINATEWVIKSDLREYNYKGRKRMVNPNYAMATGMTKRQVANKANALAHKKRKEEKYNLIGEFYDCSLKDAENLKVLEENGIKISLRTLKNFKKEIGLTRSYKKKDEQSTTDKEKTPQNAKEEANMVNPIKIGKPLVDIIPTVNFTPMELPTTPMDNNVMSDLDKLFGGMNNGSLFLQVDDTDIKLHKRCA